MCTLAVSLPLRLVTSAFQPSPEQMEQIFENLPPEAQQVAGPFLDNMFASGFAVGAIIAQFFLSLVLYSIFATLGGIVGAAIFHKKA